MQGVLFGCRITPSTKHLAIGRRLAAENSSDAHAVHISATMLHGRLGCTAKVNGRERAIRIFGRRVTM